MLCSIQTDDGYFECFRIQILIAVAAHRLSQDRPALEHRRPLTRTQIAEALYHHLQLLKTIYRGKRSLRIVAAPAPVAVAGVIQGILLLPKTTNQAV